MSCSGGVVLAAMPAAAATAEVNFVEPERYPDAGGKGGMRDLPTREVVLT